MTRFGGFPVGALDFFVELEANNERSWWLAHKDRFDTEVKEPMAALLEAVAPNGSTFHVFRMNRDVRFSSDKSPYKTNAACQFYHQDAGRGAGQDAEGAGAGLYFQVEDGQCFVAGGLWMPARATLDRIRDAVAEAPEGSRQRS